MAKGNMLLGYSRGSVGDVTFYRAGGSQRQRARNRQPNNPRTARQMAQRSVFANAVKFFKQVNSGFFRFAYEDKKTNESDYNAFMRHNVANSGYIGASASKIADFPALGLWQITAGSLQEIVAPFPQPENDTIYFDLGVTLSNNIITVGDLSSELISKAPNLWRAGDILTVLIYRATNANTLPTTATDLGNRASTAVLQLILNTNDTTELINIGGTLGNVAFGLAAADVGFRVIGDNEHWDTSFENDLYGFSVIHSRNTANGLQVSSSTMVFNKTNVVLRAMSDSGEYYNEVLADWQASAEAILQGGASAEYIPNPEVLANYVYNSTDQLWETETLGDRYHHTSTSAQQLLKCVDGNAISADDFRAEGYSSVFTFAKYEGENNPPADSYLLRFTLPSTFTGDVRIYYQDTLICIYY